MTIRPVVLAVDDDRRVLGVYQAILETRYEVLTAPNGRAALDVLQHRTVDVVLLDMMMPGLNGLGVLDALRRLGIETNVVMVSAVNDSETALEALRLGRQLLPALRAQPLEHLRVEIGGLPCGVAR